MPSARRRSNWCAGCGPRSLRPSAPPTRPATPPASEFAAVAFALSVAYRPKVRTHPGVGGAYPPPPMADLDRKLLRLMRTRGHSPALERAAIALGKAGNNGAGWFVAGGALAALDSPRRRAWASCAVLGPAAIGLHYFVKFLVKP